jgi:hypothetical protein
MCGGQRAKHLDEMLEAAFPDAAKEASEKHPVSSKVSHELFSSMHLASPSGLFANACFSVFLS